MIHFPLRSAAQTEGCHLMSRLYTRSFAFGGVRTPHDRLTSASGNFLRGSPGAAITSHTANSLLVAQGFLGACQVDGNEYTGWCFYSNQEQGEPGSCVMHSDADDTS